MSPHCFSHRNTPRLKTQPPFPKGVSLLTDKQARFLIHAAYYTAISVLIWVFLRHLLVWLLPFLLAMGLASLVEPTIESVRRRMHLQRGFLAAVFTLALLAAVIALAATLLRQLVRQATDLLQQLPLYLAGLPALADTIFQRLDEFCAACPVSVRQDVEHFLSHLPQQLSQVVGSLSTSGIRAMGGLMASLPQAVLFCVTTTLAVFFSISAYPAVTAFFRRQLRPERQRWVSGVRDNLLTTLGKWLRAQCILLLITFSELLTGFLLLRQPYALLLAVTAALIDALPVFGTGTVLLPWAAVLFLVGNVPRAIALTALYAVIALVRSFTEPRIMAAQAGLPPLLALMAMYVGFRTLGVGGMVLLPIILLLTKQLHDTGYIKLWK